MNEFETNSQVRVEARYQAMGGQFYFMAYPQANFSRRDVSKIFDQAFAEVARIETKFTDFKPSPFNAINAATAPVKLDEETWQLFMRANEFSKLTGGLFDITFATLGHRLRAKEKELTCDEYTHFKSLIDYTKLKFDHVNRTVERTHPELRVGFGGIGKGYAVDRAFEILKQAGLVNFYVNGSGDIRVHAKENAPRPWKLGIRNPFAAKATQACGIVELMNGALVTSGDYVQKNHIINPRSDKKSELVSTTLIGDNALEMDVLATALMNMPMLEALQFSNANNLAVILINHDGKSYLSQKAQKFFKTA